MKDEHRNFVLSSWLHSFRHSTYAHRIKKNVYFRYQELLSSKILADSTCKVMVDPQDHGHLYGYVVFNHSLEEMDLIHYLYIKGDFQGLGLGKRLLQEAITLAPIKYYTHKVDHHGKQWITKWIEEKIGINYNPYLAR